MTQFEIYYDWKLGVQLVFDRVSLGCGLNYSVKKNNYLHLSFEKQGDETNGKLQIEKSVELENQL